MLSLQKMTLSATEAEIDTPLASECQWPLPFFCGNLCSFS